MLPDGFVYLDEAVPDVFWDAKYAGSDNFVGMPVNGYRANRVVGTEELAEALCRAGALAKGKGYSLFLWDAYRPQRAVDHFVAWCAAEEDGRTQKRHYPTLERAQLIPLGYIAGRSGHSRGSTVDLTLADEQGVPIDMGGIFDFMDESSHHDSPSVGAFQSSNRRILREIMLLSGFADYVNEWWHYRLKDEPYPDRYFDFVIE